MLNCSLKVSPQYGPFRYVLTKKKYFPSMIVQKAYGGSLPVHWSSDLYLVKVRFCPAFWWRPILHSERDGPG